METSGSSPYRFDIVCDSDDVPQVKLVLVRGSSQQQFDVSCTGGDVLRVNFPAGPPVTVTVTPTTGQPTPMGLIAWNLSTLQPSDVRGCANGIEGC
ncbi:hypothetical protein ACFTWH_08905 [Streptomyces sp. NPDC057011]|uniref:hypothetical protein n=1 Tax=unclassified Streptomyces TaxID=2593676 RepID=UPI00363AC01A